MYGEGGPTLHRLCSLTASVPDTVVNGLIIGIAIVTRFARRPYG